MKTILAGACALLLAHGLHAAGADDRGQTELPPAEQAQGWRLLWDGRSTQGWRSVRGPDFPATGWRIRDGVLTVLPSAGHAGGGDIITVGKYADFELTADFRVTPGANSGIKIFVDPAVNPSNPSLGLEYQILDDALNPDARQGRDGNRTLGSLYDLYPPSPAKRPRPVGDWNTAVIISRGPRVEHWLNGDRILEYTRFTTEFRRRVGQSKFRTVAGFGELPEGHILLQAHGDEVSFRNIKIRVLAAQAAPPQPEGAL